MPLITDRNCIAAIGQFKPEEIARMKSRLLGSLLFFTQVFYKYRTGREFIVSQPIGRESHHIAICRELTELFYGRTNRLIINIPPRYGKTELLIHFTAWAMAHYPDSNFNYICYSLGLAKKATQIIREIMTLPAYRQIFGVELSKASTAKHDFHTTDGGSVYAAGCEGTLTGYGSGIYGITDRFGGCQIIDDIHKPDEAASDVMRENVIDWFFGTAQSRLNEPQHTPIIDCGQRVHELDLTGFLQQNQGEYWKNLVLPALDAAANALNPAKHDLPALMRMKKENPYHFAAQMQQDPQPAGGGIFKNEWFYLMGENPDILLTFLTVDTAETSKTYNDASVFSFWGLYEIKHGDSPTGLYGLHWIDCVELRVEPKDLENEFLSFYAQCMQFPVKPIGPFIEKKSTGVTLCSTLKRFQGMRIVEVDRADKKSKADRFLAIQKYISTQRVSLHRFAKHTEMCISHCAKITANDSHRFDDIADTLEMAVNVALEKNMLQMFLPKSNSKKGKSILAGTQTIDSLRRSAYAAR